MTTCRSCGAAMTWARSFEGKAMPMQRDDHGMWTLDDRGVAHMRTTDSEGPFYTSHFATCPQSAQWRKRA